MKTSHTARVLGQLHSAALKPEPAGLFRRALPVGNRRQIALAGWSLGDQESVEADLSLKSSNVRLLSEPSYKTFGCTLLLIGSGWEMFKYYEARFVPPRLAVQAAEQEVRMFRRLLQAASRASAGALHQEFTAWGLDDCRDFLPFAVAITHNTLAGNSYARIFNEPTFQLFGKA
jgi:hypothetical protein